MKKDNKVCYSEWLRDRMREINIRTPKLADDTGIPKEKIAKWLDGPEIPSYTEQSIIQAYLQGKIELAAVQGRKKDKGDSEIFDSFG